MTSVQPIASPWPPSVIPAVWPPPLPGVPSTPSTLQQSPQQPMFPQVPQIQQVQPPTIPVTRQPPTIVQNQLPLGGGQQIQFQPLPQPTRPVTPNATLPVQQNRTGIAPSTLARWGQALQGSLFGEERPSMPIGHTTVAIGAAAQLDGAGSIVDHITDNEKLAILIVTLVLSSFSILLALLMILAYFICRYIYPTLVDRITLRLCILIAVVDVFYAVNQMWSAFVSTSNVACTFSVWSYIFLTLLFIFLTDAIAFNLHMVFVRERRYTSRLEKWYYIVPFFLATAATVPGWAAGRYGYDPSMKTCWFIEQGTRKTLLWEFLSYYIWAFVGILYCLFVVIIVLNKLFVQRRKLEKALTETASKANYRFSRKVSTVSRMSAQRMTKNFQSMTPDQIQLLQQREASKETSRVVVRIVRYPMIPIFTQVWNMANDLTLYTTKRTFFWLLLMCYIATALQGVLNFLAFSYDPSIQQALDELRTDAIEWYQKDEILLERSGLKDQAHLVFTFRKRMVRAFVWFWYVRNVHPDDLSTYASDSTETLSQATLDQLNNALSKIEEEEEEDYMSDASGMEVEVILPSPPAYPLPTLTTSVRFDDASGMEQGGSPRGTQWLRPTTSSGPLTESASTTRRSSGIRSIRSRGNSLSSLVPPQF